MLKGGPGQGVLRLPSAVSCPSSLLGPGWRRPLERWTVSLLTLGPGSGAACDSARPRPCLARGRGKGHGHQPVLPSWGAPGLGLGAGPRQPPSEALGRQGSTSAPREGTSQTGALRCWRRSGSGPGRGPLEPGTWCCFSLADSRSREATQEAGRCHPARPWHRLRGGGSTWARQLCSGRSALAALGAGPFSSLSLVPFSRNPHCHSPRLPCCHREQLAGERSGG